MANGHGGRRPGAGRKPGVPNKLSRELRERAQGSGIAMLNEQVRLALGAASENVRANCAERVLNRGFGRPALERTEDTESTTPATMNFTWDPTKAETYLAIRKAQEK